ncbi:MAG: D-galactarate dehydratase [Euryarchaeota archaeon]|nr:D-galactarate dehydratase [Euryarchaeota archaeon]
MKAKAIRIDAKDNVATALSDLRAGESVVVKGGMNGKVKVLQDIQFGHKFATLPIGKGQEVIKYGETIGRATADIKKGEHVHVHNIESMRGRGDIPEAEG